MNKENMDNGGVAQQLYTDAPETSFTRSISNPEAVMRRRRQQKLEKKLQQFHGQMNKKSGKVLRSTLSKVLHEYHLFLQMCHFHKIHEI